MSRTKLKTNGHKSGAKAADLQARLLNWYDRHQRVLPWRSLPGKRPDPYHVWLSEIMLQQTTVVTVGPYFQKFLQLFPTVKALAKAPQEKVLAAWAGLGYYARARNLHKCALVVANEKDGVFPSTVEELEALPGIGPYTAAAVASIAFDRPAVAVDGNVERVTSRFFAITEPLPLSKSDIRAKAAYLAEDVSRPGDFTQAFMELGATVCVPRNPKCGICPWHDGCAARKLGIAESLPAKTPKKARPPRRGRVFWIVNKKGQFLIHQRREKGLYENMYQLPTTDWVKDAKPKDAAGLDIQWKLPVKLENTGVEVHHTLTHFDLILEIWAGRSDRIPVEGGIWIDDSETGDYALPSLMMKAIKLMT